MKYKFIKFNLININEIIKLEWTFYKNLIKKMKIIVTKILSLSTDGACCYLLNIGN